MSYIKPNVNVTFTSQDRDESDINWVWTKIGERPNIYFIDSTTIEKVKLDEFLETLNYEDQKVVQKVVKVFDVKSTITDIRDELRHIGKDVYISYTVEEGKVFNLFLMCNPTMTDKEVYETYIFPVMELRNKKKKRSNKVFYTITYSQYEGYGLKPCEIDKIKMSIIDNYNDDFLSISSKIESAVAKDVKGLIMLYGEPGTGKTYYLRHLISKYSGKRNFIYIPVNMVSHFSEPDFKSFLEDHPNSVLIIEDAKDLISKDNMGDNISISNMLNMTDGLLNDSLNFLMIVTSNVNVNDVNPALLRAGRLICEYSFDKLTADKANKLALKLKREVSFTNSVILAEVYNEKPESKRRGSKIGFKN